ncbi:ABC transporter ATP-binding protein [Christensenellaceae bacterium OttesenSCG-928-L17]|nr:ABC transporter ATP-binding protein [Christensenellaceae bacterium OttesenSCG-928-L17]
MIAVRNISFSYPGSDVLKGISFDALPGECVGVLGNNGAGKSTLITCLNNIRTPKTGEAFVDGKDIYKMGRNELARTVSYVAQKNEINQMTVFDSVLLGRTPYIKWSVSQEDMDICNDMIAQVGLQKHKLRNIDELSGGELQKVMLARAFVQQPKLLLLDEPTSNLDPKNQYEMLALVQSMARERNISVLIAIHDLSLALRYCDKFLFLKNGAVFRFGDCSIVTPETISAVYDTNAIVTEIDGRKVVVIA